MTNEVNHGITTHPTNCDPLILKSLPRIVQFIVPFSYNQRRGIFSELFQVICA